MEQIAPYLSKRPDHPVGLYHPTPAACTTQRLNLRISGQASAKLEKCFREMAMRPTTGAKLIIEAAAGIEPGDFYNLLALIRNTVNESNQTAIKRFKSLRD